MKENPIRSLPGIPMLLAILVAELAAVWLFLTSVDAQTIGGIAAALLLAVVAAFCLIGLYMVEPNQAAVLSLFGKYVGTVKDNGLRWNNPFYGKRKVSQRVRNFES